MQINWTFMHNMSVHVQECSTVIFFFHTAVQFALFKVIEYGSLQLSAWCQIIVFLMLKIEKLQI